MSGIMFIGEKSIHKGTNSSFLTVPSPIVKEIGEVKKAKVYYDVGKKEMIVKFF